MTVGVASNFTFLHKAAQTYTSEEQCFLQINVKLSFIVLEAQVRFSFGFTNIK